MEEKKKKALFEGLCALDDDNIDDVEDLSGIDTILRQSKPLTSGRPHGVSKMAGPRAIDIRHTNQARGRTVSAPICSSVSFPDTIPLTKATPLSGRRSSAKIEVSGQVTTEANFKRTTLTAMYKTSRSSKKRKRGQSVALLPESQRIFQGLSFYFLPNDDVAPARRLRIRKAMEYGAVWIKEWKDGMTHIIMDNSLCYKDLLSYLKIDSLPPKVVLVNESYPSSCIQFRALIDPNRPQHRVEGCQEDLRAKHSIMPSSSSETSLQLKSTKQTGEFGETPSRTEGSSQDVSCGDAPGSSRDSVVQEVANSPSIPAACAKDDMAEVIQEARITKYMPLDFDDDEDTSGRMGFGDRDDEDSEEEQRPTSRAKPSLNSARQQNFSCTSKHDGIDKGENPNAHTIEILQQMADYYARTKDHWRTTAYRKVIGQLKKQPQKIVTSAQASQIPWVGERLAAKIEEIVWTNKLRRLENTKLEPNDEVLQKFIKIYGVGFVQATKWVEQGHRTLRDLLEKAQLTKNQKIGIERFDDFQTRIPRQEMSQHDRYMRETARKIDSSLQFTIGGSYRRGAADSGDVDFIVTKANAPIETIRSVMIDKVIPRLFAAGYLKVGLATTSKDDGTKWHGAATLPGHQIWRRIDFLFVPWDEMGAALIYFTGNDIFNRSIRLLASKKGMRLNQRGLWKDVIRGKDRARMTQGTLMEGKDEKEIFELLGVLWRPPEHRIC